MFKFVIVLLFKWSGLLIGRSKLGVLNYLFKWFNHLGLFRLLARYLVAVLLELGGHVRDLGHAATHGLGDTLPALG